MLPSSIQDAELQFRFELLPSWIPGPAKPQEGWVTTIAEAHRRPETGRSYVVAPRLVVTAEPARSTDPDALIRATMEDLEALEKNKAVRIKRTAVSARFVDGIKIGDLEMSYDVQGGARDSTREVVHRSVVALRHRKDGSATALTVTVTYMAEDAELVGPEVHRMLSGLEFREILDRPLGK